jgi:hypothetical protein
MYQVASMAELVACWRWLQRTEIQISAQAIFNILFSKQSIRLILHKPAHQSTHPLLIASGQFST